MIDVTDHWWIAIIIAAAGGAAGGLVYELLLSRHNDAGMLELFSRHTIGGLGNRKYIDIGFLASVLVGIVAAVSFLYFFAPEVTTVVDSAGKASTTRSYDPFKLIAASLIVGSSGAAFIVAMQQRLLKTITAASLQNLIVAVQAGSVHADAVVAEFVERDEPPQPSLAQLQAHMNLLDQLSRKIVQPPPS